MTLQTSFDADPMSRVWEFHFYLAGLVLILMVVLLVLDQSEDQKHPDTWPDLHRLKTPHPKEHDSLRAPYRTGTCHRARIALHVSCTIPNHTPHNPETAMTNERLYKGELTSPSRYTSLFTTLLTHSFSISLLT